MPETKLNIVVVDFDYENNKVICRVIETGELRMFDTKLFSNNFFDTPDVDDEFIVTITEGSGFVELKIVPEKEKKSRIT